MSTKRKPSPVKDILFLSISSFIVVVAWIGFNLYHSFVTSTITPELQMIITPISPDFDTATIENLKSRKQVVPVTKLSNTSEPTGPLNVASPLQSGTTLSVTPTPAAQNETQEDEENIPVIIEGE